MATLEEEQEHRDRLRALLEQLKAIDADSLDRVDELGQALSFKDGQPFFQRALRLFRDLEEASLDALPSQILQTLLTHAQDANNLFTEIQGFSLQAHPQNPTQARDDLINAIRDSYDSWFYQISPIIAYSVRKGTDFERLEREAREQVSHIEQIQTKLQEQGKEIVAEIQEILEQVRRAAQEVGVAQHAVHFKSEADRHKVAAGKWLQAVQLIAGITAFLTVVNVVLAVGWYRSLSLTTAETIQLAIAKVILFSLLFSALVWVGRVYRSHQHNFVVNQHRQNALTSFETFAEAAQDEQTKSAVLLQATNCIFAPQASGYADSSAEAPGTPQVMEIIRNMATRD